MKFDQKFGKYACIGDTITADVTKKMKLVAAIVFDDQCQPSDFDCYDEQQIERWQKDEWYFVGVVLSLQSHDGTIKAHLGSLWGNECHLGDNDDWLTEIANELIDEKQILNTLQSINEPVTRAIEALTHTN
jgi:hypothetical protein